MEVMQKQELDNIRRDIEKFQGVLNTPPNQDPKKGKVEVLVNAMAGNSLYVPISHVEMKLDELFFGQWWTENFKSQVVVNEIIGSIELVVLHPVTLKEIRRVGAASAMIMQSRGSAIDDITKKIKNTLVKDYPKLKIECIKNAAKSLGAAFGRDLNRRERDIYDPIMNKVDTIKAIEPAKILSEVKDELGLKNILEQNTDWMNNPKIVYHIATARKRLRDAG